MSKLCYHYNENNMHFSLNLNVRWYLIALIKPFISHLLNLKPYKILNCLTCKKVRQSWKVLVLNSPSKLNLINYCWVLERSVIAGRRTDYILKPSLRFRRGFKDLKRNLFSRIFAFPPSQLQAGSEGSGPRQLSSQQSKSRWVWAGLSFNQSCLKDFS